MNDAGFANVIGRLERLERQNRRLRWGGVAVAALLGGLLVMGATSPPIVEAERFVVRDAEGTVRAVLGVPDEGLSKTLKLDQRGALLALYNTHGKVRTVLSIGPEGPERVEVPRLEMMDATGGPRVDLNVGSLGPRLLLADERTIARVGLSLLRGRPALSLLDPDSKAQATLRLEKPGEHALTFLDEKGQRRTVLGLSEQDPNLLLYDADGKLRIQLGRSPSGQGLVLYDTVGQYRALLDVREGGPVFDLRNAYGGLLNRGP
ncbi:MAG TPA: hypothetical protein VM221_14275 [Armatimonadota bacterium]|nr:hypothetical protein [Armatimonadota bacterium]